MPGGFTVRVLLTSAGRTRRIDAASIAAVEVCVAEALWGAFEVAEVRVSQVSNEAATLLLASPLPKEELNMEGLESLCGGKILGQWSMVVAEYVEEPVIEKVQYSGQPHLDRLMQEFLDKNAEAREKSAQDAVKANAGAEASLGCATSTLREALERHADASLDQGLGTMVRRLGRSTVLEAAKNAAVKAGPAPPLRDISPSTGGPVTGDPRTIRPLQVRPLIATTRESMSDEVQSNEAFLERWKNGRMSETDHEDLASQAMQRFNQAAAEKAFVYPSVYDKAPSPVQDKIKRPNPRGGSLGDDMQ